MLATCSFNITRTKLYILKSVFLPLFWDYSDTNKVYNAFCCIFTSWVLIVSVHKIFVIRNVDARGSGRSSRSPRPKDGPPHTG